MAAAAWLGWLRPLAAALLRRRQRHSAAAHRARWVRAAGTVRVGLPSRRGTSVGWLPALLALVTVFVAAYVCSCWPTSSNWVWAQLGVPWRCWWAGRQLGRAVPGGAAPAPRARVAGRPAALVGGAVSRACPPTASRSRSGSTWPTRSGGQRLRGGHHTRHCRRPHAAGCARQPARPGRHHAAGRQRRLLAIAAPQFDLPHPPWRYSPTRWWATASVRPEALRRAAPTACASVPRNMATSSIEVPAAGRSIGFEPQPERHVDR